jgi:cardiolipin synthase
MFNGPMWLLILHLCMAAPAVGHALLGKRHSRSALGWIAFIIGYPIVGPVLYGLFGINRVRTRSRQLRDENDGKSDFHRAGKKLKQFESAEDWQEFTESERRLLRIGTAVTTSPVQSDNTVEMLINGEEAYPSMLEAIDNATERVWLTTYIFETNQTGKKFIDALVAAHSRGVDVRVIIDGVGEFYSWPHAGRLLKKRGVAVERYLRPRLIPPQIYLNLRNHRKILVVDSKVAFTGGMNIGGRHMVEPPETKAPVQDLQFKMTGPIVRDMEELFLHDWRYVTRSDESYEPACEPEEPARDPQAAFCRLIPDGPDHDLNKLETVYHSVVAAADHRVVIVSPYFLPTEQMHASITAAAIRGVDVTVILPEKTNLPYVRAATNRSIRWLMKNNVKVMLQPPPFSHAKLLLVDESYVLLGSANVDPRSLRLNFELAVEIIHRDLVETADAYLDEILERSRELTLEDLEERSLFKRLGDGFFWLFSPYL